MPSVYLQNNDDIYRFVNYSVSKTDGSFYISLLREGTSAGHIVGTFHPTSNTLSDNIDELVTNRRKTKKISYHPTGYINYHDIQASRVIGEPLGSISQPFYFLSYSIPSIQKLNKQVEPTKEEDSIFEFAMDDDKRTTFSFVVAPWNFSFEGKVPLFSINYYQFMSITVFIEDISVSEKFVDHFIYLTPPKGLYENTLLDKDQALIRFHQLLNQTNDMILYSPDAEGFYKLVFTVPMRVPPIVEIEFEDDSLSIVEGSKSKSSVRFKVVDKNNKTIKESVSIKGIALDAEIY